MNDLLPHPEEPASGGLPSLREILSGSVPLSHAYASVACATLAELSQACDALTSAQVDPTGVDTPVPPSADGQRAMLRTVVQQRYAQELHTALEAIPSPIAELLHPRHGGPLGLVTLAIHGLHEERSAYLTADPADRLRLLNTWVSSYVGFDPARYPELAGLIRRSLEICAAAEVDKPNHQRGLLLARHHGVLNRRLGEETDALIHLGAGRLSQAAVLPHHYWVSTPTSMELALGLSQGD